MSKQTINVGSADLAGDGESIRNAFTKVNSNFTEIYTQVPLATTATYAQSFNTSTLVRAAVSATNVVNGTWTLALSTAGSILLNGTVFSSGAGSATTSTLVNGTYTVSLSTSGNLTFPGGYLKVVPNGANPYISNRTDNGLGLVSGSVVKIRQSTADAYGITIDSSTSDTSLGGGAELAGGSSIDVNGTKIILGQYTTNYIDANTGLTSQNKIEINNNTILIGQKVSTITSGVTTSTFNGWTFSNTGTLTFPDATVQTTAYTGLTPNGTKASTATGTAGQTSYDSTYFYVCIATNTWRRVALGSTY